MKAIGIQPVKWDNDQLHLIDQRLLPDEMIYLNYQNSSSAADAITDMVVRGAPAIGITAAYAVVLAAKEVLDVSANGHRAINRLFSCGKAYGN